MVSGARMMNMAALGLAAVLLGAPAAQAEIFRWVDEHGVTQFGARPPVDAATERVHVYDGGGDPDAGARLDELRDSLAEARAARERRRADAASAAAQREHAQAQCAAARAHRERAANATRLFRVNAAGEREKVGEAERAADLARVDAAIAEYCR
ncbi:MAG: DUF4124 domain-containing protein [Gammaproteobacteria bacterium]